MKRIFVSTLMFFECNLQSVNQLECVLMNNQECKVRPKIVNVNSNEPVFHPFSIKTSKCSGSCNNIDDSYAKLCVSDVVKNIDIKVYNLMSRTNETRHVSGMKLVNVSVYQMQVFLTVNTVGIKINADVNVKN